MKTIVHVITGLNDGGAEAALYRLCTHDKSNHHHVISLMDGGKYGPMLEARGISVSCINMPRGKLTLGGAWQLRGEIKRNFPDVVQTWMYHADLMGGVAARLAGVRNIVWGIHHTTLVSGESSRATIMVMKLCARLSRIVPRRIICCAEKARDVHAEKGYDRSRMRVVPNGHDVTIFRPDLKARYQIRNELELPDNLPVIGFVARFDPQKDHKNLLQALGNLKAKGLAPICLLVGTNMNEANRDLTAMIHDLGLNDQVKLLGLRNDIPAIMNALDLHVMSSAFGEAFPNVLCEAMACGTPCVTTDVGDASLIVGETGWVVPPRDRVALAKAIAQALDKRHTPDWKDRRDQANDRINANFTIGGMVDNYNLVWNT
ncbi:MULTISPECIES: glycosyltransferase [unclassified Sulfitobacter]|uniref:glycosyltransferase family 4 protein n=1 Tax=unclassified Sulfitobacter TaxID=196795 RepID=UPI0023E12E2C|nr:MULTISPECIES: glycosyltransferase [unclassified Sulfitobacter]MDF3384584.1 glycosyltransferase [Sulfitobacter sp. Ks11]MDF3388073.1 glycosyltransferase [Sulfitobacter sp. M85]MDF3391493.1 glycosyltransferase [Sulfitobacter sp. Ks16]MDF3402060.1 glycosyltransferase [Sulfitobacter sp. KE39]MDF3405552.1 glycosyltransferase [Sulfitobacter sp. Ks35]